MITAEIKRFISSFVRREKSVFFTTPEVLLQITFFNKAQAGTRLCGHEGHYWHSVRGHKRPLQMSTAPTQHL